MKRINFYEHDSKVLAHDGTNWYIVMPVQEIIYSRPVVNDSGDSRILRTSPGVPIGENRYMGLQEIRNEELNAELDEALKDSE